MKLGHLLFIGLIIFAVYWFMFRKG